MAILIDGSLSVSRASAKTKPKPSAATTKSWEKAYTAADAGSLGVTPKKAASTARTPAETMKRKEAMATSNESTRVPARTPARPVSVFNPPSPAGTGMSADRPSATFAERQKTIDILATASPYASQAMQAGLDDDVRETKDRAATLQRNIDVLGTSGGYATEAMQAELNGIKKELAAYRTTRQNFAGERGELFDSVALPSDGEFADLVAEGSIAQPGGRQTRYFETHAEPGDGVIVTEFVIQEETSGGFLLGDGRAITRDPLGTDLPLDASRMIVVIDRETGRGAITVSPSSATFGVDVDVDVNILGRPGQFPINVNRDPEVGARPISFESGSFSNYIPQDLIPENYFRIEADGDNIRIDYDAVNSVTAFGQAISVDGPIVLERGDDGNFTIGGDHSPDLYPAVAVTQYTPEGERVSVYFEEGKNVFEGATPPAVGEIFEGGREIYEEGAELVDEVGHAAWLEKPDELVEGAVEIVWQTGEAAVQIVDDAVLGGEIEEGAGELAEEWNEGGREIGEASWYRKPDQTVEAGGELVYETGEAAVETVKKFLFG